MTTIKPFNAPFTIERWMDSWQTNQVQAFVSLDASKTLDIYRESGFGANMKILTNGTLNDSEIPCPFGRHYWVVTYDGSSTVKVYIDTALALTASATLNAFSGTGALLRWANSGGFSTFASRFRKFASYNAVLSSTQIGINFTTGNGV